MLRITILLISIAMTACAAGSAPTQPAPAGDKAVLERLAAAYSKLAENLPVSPTRMPPEQRKAFVDKVFAASGYSYTATLHKMAEGGWDPNDKNARDLVELLFLPHTNIRPGDSVAGVYSEQELADVRKVQRMLPQ